MSPFAKAKNDVAFLKMAVFGEPGSGKSYTSSLIAIGLHNYANLKKPIYLIDTEASSAFVKPLFDNAKIELIVSKSTAFADLMIDIKKAEKEASLLLIDSMTAIWWESMSAYKCKKKLSRLTLRHIGEIKEEWKKFNQLYVNSKLHIIFCARSGWNWTQVVDEEGFTELQKTGTRPKTESELQYESNIVLEFERFKGSQVGGLITNRCTVVKDRTNEINNNIFDFPKFENFLPHIKFLNLKGEHKGIDLSRTSESYFRGRALIGDKIRLYEEIEAELKSAFSTKQVDVKAKYALLQDLFGTTSMYAIQHQLSFDTLKEGLIKLRKTDIDKYIESFEKEKKK